MIDPAIKCWNFYATDGRCHNSEDGEHECHAPAVWIGERETLGGPWRCGYCDHCRREGREARHMTKWFRITDQPAGGGGTGPHAAGQQDPGLLPPPSSATMWWASALGRLNGGQQS